MNLLHFTVICIGAICGFVRLGDILVTSIAGNPSRFVRHAVAVVGIALGFGTCWVAADASQLQAHAIAEKFYQLGKAGDQHVLAVERGKSQEWIYADVPETPWKNVVCYSGLLLAFCAWMREDFRKWGWVRSKTVAR